MDSCQSDYKQVVPVHFTSLSLYRSSLVLLGGLSLHSNCTLSFNSTSFPSFLPFFGQFLALLERCLVVLHFKVLVFQGRDSEIEQIERKTDTMPPKFTKDSCRCQCLGLGSGLGSGSELGSGLGLRSRSGLGIEVGLELGVRVRVRGQGQGLE